MSEIKRDSGISALSPSFRYDAKGSPPFLSIMSSFFTDLDRVYLSLYKHMNDIYLSCPRNRSMESVKKFCMMVWSFENN